MQSRPVNGKEAQLAKLEFIELVAHELKQPVTAIQGYAKMLLMGIGGELGETHREFAHIINANAERMGKLVNDLLDISRLEAGCIKLKLAPVEFSEIVDSTLVETRGKIEECRHSLEVSIPEDLPAVLGDRERLIQILTSLVSNACQYTPEGGAIGIAAARDHPADASGDYLRISVSDSGIGMSDTEIAQLDKFFRADHDLVRAHPGAGLGLSIARHLVQLHGGELTIESQVSQGSTFSFTVPTTSMSAD